MKRVAKLTFAALLLAGTAALTATPASARVGIGLSFGYGPGFVPFSDPCDYYNYYNEPPPWGLPPDYCNYPVYFDPVYYGGSWYRGPIYYRWYGGQRLYWLNGGWRHDGWRGARPSIHWQDRGGWGHRSGWNRGGYNRSHSYNSGGSRWSGSGHNWQDRGRSNWSGDSNRGRSGSGHTSGYSSGRSSGGGHSSGYSGGRSGGGHSSGGGHGGGGGHHR
ncbi:MAG TPA: hypothetical protein VGC27_02370 [Rhizomicrobium sp.]